MEKLKIFAIFILTLFLLVLIIFIRIIDSEIKENERLGIEFSKDQNKTYTDIEIQN